MLLTETCDVLRQDVIAARHQVRWDEVRARRPELAELPDARALLAALDGTVPPEHAAADRLVRALIAEHQASRDPLWASILVVVFYPMLCRIAVESFEDARGIEDRVQLVLQEFLQAIREYALRGRDRRVSLALRLKTRRGVMDRLRKDRRSRAVAVDPAVLARLQERQTAFSTVDQMEEAALAVARLATIPDVANLLRPEPRRDSLRRRIRERHPDASPAEHERLYQREKRRRGRGVRRVRAAVRELLGSPVVRTHSSKGNP